jgi:hypothetical protein
MKSSRILLVVVATVLIAAASGVAFAGIEPPPAGVVPEPTAMLVWLGLAAAGGLLHSRRNRDEP